MKQSIIFFILLISSQLHAQQSPQELIRGVNQKFNLVKDYKADMTMNFDLPGVKMNQMKGKVLFKRPDKFKIKAKGIFFMPKQNPIQNISTLLQDTTSYTSIISGYENIQNQRCAIINIIPLKTDQELIIGKFWIDVKDPLVKKSQITTKNNGTIESINQYGAFQNYMLPDQIQINVEVNKIKVPKMMSVDLNKKSKAKKETNVKEIGHIIMQFERYQINTKLGDEQFKEEI